MSCRSSLPSPYAALLCALSVACGAGKPDAVDSTRGAGGSAPSDNSARGAAGGAEVGAPGGAGGTETVASSVSDPSETTVSNGGAPSAVCSGELPVPPADEECQAFAELACSRLLECKPRFPSHNDGISDLSMELCLSRQVATCEPLNLPGSLLNNARLSECMARLESASCALVRGGPYALGMQGCTELGMFAEGERCERFHQCASAACRDGLCSGTPRTSPLRDWAYDIGETPEGSNCNNRFLELNADRCELAGSGEGGACPCNKLEGLECMCGALPCACAGESVCPSSSEGTCAPPPTLREGATCRVAGESSSVSGWCEAGTVCFSDGNTRCVTAATEGAPCTANGLGSTCAPGLACAPRGEATWTGTCVSPAACSDG